MNWKFIGRTRELAALEEQYQQPESNFIPIYGRRRVGKSELILRFKGERPGIYFVGKQAPAALQIHEVMLCLAVSYVGFMEREVLGSQKPLGGRRTARILLEPFKQWEAAQFHPRLSNEDQARIYFITGGIPLYLLAFKQNKSLHQNILDTLLDEFSPLSHEPEFLLREELHGLERFQAVLDTLAGGRKALHEVAKAVGVDSRSVTYQLHVLSPLGYVECVLPLTAREA